MAKAKKFLALLLSLILFISSAPLTAFAASSGSGTLSAVRYNCIKTGGADRWSDPVCNLVNDGNIDTFSFMILQYDISRIKLNPGQTITASENFVKTANDNNSTGITFYYATKYDDMIEHSNNSSRPEFVDFYNGEEANGNTRSSKVVDYFGLEVIQSFSASTINGIGSNGNISVSYSNAINDALNRGMHYFTVIAMQPYSDNSINGSPWTDTHIKSNKSLSYKIGGYSMSTTTGSITPTRRSCFCAGSENRYSGKYQICNDGASNNFSFMVLQYDISGLSNKTIMDAKLTVEVSGKNSPVGLNFYYANNPTYASNLIDTSSSTGKESMCGGNSTNESNWGMRRVKGLSEYFKLRLVDSFSSDQLPSSGNLTIDYTDALNSYIQNGNRYFTIIACQPSADGSINKSSWTDFNLKDTAYALSYSAANTPSSQTAPTDEIIGNIDADPVIWTHGTFYGDSTNFAGIHDVSDNKRYDYMMNGSRISDGTYNGEYTTKISTGSKTVAKVEVVGAPNAGVWINNGHLEGNLGENYEDVIQSTTDRTAKLKFTYTDGKYEYYTFAVKANPVNVHTMATGFAVSTTAFASIPKKAHYVLGTTALGSICETKDGAATTNTNTSLITLNDRNFVDLFKKNGPSGHYDTFDASENSYAIKVDGVDDDGILFTDKSAGYFVKTPSRYELNSLETSWVDSNTAHYYLDLSSSKNLGITHQANSGNFSIDLINYNTYFASYPNVSIRTQGEGFTRDSENSSDGISLTTTDVFDTNWTIKDNHVSGEKLVGNVQKDASNKFKTGTVKGYSRLYQYSADNNTKLACYLETNIAVHVVDKGVARSYYEQVKSQYNHYITCYTVQSWNDYTAALARMEAFLNNYEASATASEVSAMKADLQDHLPVLSEVQADHAWDDGVQQGRRTVYTCTRCDKQRTDGQELNQPTFTGNTLLGPNDTITITMPQDAVKLSVKLGDATPIVFNGNATFAPFGTGYAAGSDSVQIKATALDEDDYASPEASVRYTYFKAPNISVGNNSNLDADAVVSFTSAMASQYQGTLQYSLDGGTTWQTGNQVQPFVANPNQLVLTLSVREINGTSTSEVSTVTLFKNENLAIYSQTGDVISEDEYAGTSAFFIRDSANYNDTIYYSVAVDGGAHSVPAVYNRTTGIPATPYADNAVVEIKAYSLGTGNPVIGTQQFINKDFDRLIYHESFDDAKVEGTRFLTGSAKGINGTLRVADSASVQLGAGDTHGDSARDTDTSQAAHYVGSSSDWRENVLKFNATTTLPGHYLVMDRNPLADAQGSASLNYLAQNKGITISFWRHFETTNGGRVKSLGKKNSTEYNWRNIMTFTSDTVGTASDHYYMIEANGENSFAKDTTNSNAKNFLHYVPDNQDVTSHAAGNDNGYWINFVITIDPAKGITLYANGDPHEYTIKHGTVGMQANNDAAAAELISFLCNSNTTFTLNNGNNWDANENDLYLDDIRIYTDVLTQVDIYNMYNDKNSDVANGSATSHDPTNVTVYTLAGGTYGSGSKTITVPAGKTVGYEFIEYYGVDPTDTNQVTNIEYYSFGTGMTIYKSSDNINWTVVGDSQGRCGYWNEDLFGAHYLTALAEPQKHVTDNTSATGAGKLVWAPHVMYNLTLNKWVYYAACSVWGTAASATFMAVSSDDTIEHYTYQGIVKKSNGRPNVIDSCVFYGRDTNGNIDINQLYMTHGAWAESGHPEKDLVACQLNANGTSKNVNAAPNGGDSTARYIGSSIDVTGEGSYVYYHDGYYYLYVSYGENKGNYSERVYRSQNPIGPFKDYYNVDATDTTDTSATSTRGQQILNSFYSSIYNYVYVSTGHNSVYTAINDKGEEVVLNAAHARPYANDMTQWKALEDASFSTRQSDLTGNVTIINPTVYTEEKWPVLLPYQYNGTDTDNVKFSISDITGVYNACDLGSVLGYGIADSYTYTIFENEDEDAPNTAILYGSRPNGDPFNYILQIVESNDSHTYFNLYSPDDPTKTVKFKGAFGQHTEKGKDIVEFGMYDLNSGIQSWSYKASEIPAADQEARGDYISHSQIIYTHEIDGSYAKYGREISDNFEYNTNGITSGERCTTIQSIYPYYLDTTSKTTIYSLTSEEFAKQGYAGGMFEVVDLDKCWVDKETGETYTDNQAKAAYEASNGEIVLTKTYGLKGMVSSYFVYGENGYPQTGVKLLVNYYSKLPADAGKQFGEYEFLYVMPNPDWAHEIVAIRNQNNANGIDKRISNATFSRFVDSEGSATNVSSTMTAGMGAHPTSEMLRGTGKFEFVSTFGDEVSVNTDYTTPSKIRDHFDFYGQNIGVTAGAYACLEHNDDNQRGYGISTPVVNVDYYIDYSDKSQYGKHIRVNGDKKPIGFTFDLKLSNLNWNPKGDTSVASSFVKNVTGMTAHYSSSFQNESTKLSTVGSDEDCFLDFNNEGNTGPDYRPVNRHSEFGAYAMMSSSGGYTFTNGFPYIDTGKGATNNFTGTATFYGKDTVSQNTDRTSAESLANYILQTGTITSYKYSGKTGYIAEDNYMYYNLGVSTCDKGAVREFLDKYANREMKVVYDDNNNKYIVPGDPIDSSQYSVASYKEYLNALAEAYFFIENPHNTTYNGTGSSATAANDKTGEHEYVTAYRVASQTINCRDEDNHPYTITREAGSAVYNSEEIGRASDTTIFGVAGATTDPVQKKIIDDVITACDDLFNKEDFKAAVKDYNDTVDDLQDLLASSRKGNFTTTSVNVWDDLLSNITDAYDYYLEKESPVDGQEYWRYCNLSGSEYRILKEVYDTIEDSLMPIIDTTVLKQNIQTQTDNITPGIFNGDSQIYTYSSWLDICDEIDVAQGYVDDTSVAVDGFLLGKYAVTGTKTYTYRNSNGEESTYTYQTYDSAEKNNEAESEDPKYYSTLQTNVSKEDGDDGLLMKKTLVRADWKSSYEAFDDSCAIISAIDTNKYDDGGTALINKVNELIPNVEVEITQAQANRYNSIVGADSVKSGDTLYLTTEYDTDPYTFELLSFISSYEAAHTKQFEARYYVDGALSDTSTKKYGDKFIFENPSDEGTALVSWEVKTYATRDDMIANENVLSTSTIYSALPDINYVADAFVRVEVSTETPDSTAGTYKVNIANVYGRIIKIAYVNDLSVVSTLVQAEKVPFYSFEGWKNPVSMGNDEYLVRPDYRPIPAACNIEVVDGTGEGSYKYDTRVRIEYTGEDDFVAWAVEKDDNLYQIASYSDEYSFFSVMNEKFVPVINDGGVCKIGENAVTAEMLGYDSTSTSFKYDRFADEYNASDSTSTVDHITIDDFVQKKLLSKSPFISIIKTAIVDDAKARAYIRVSEGAKYTSLGIVFDKTATISDANMKIGGTGATYKTVSNVLTTGQYSVTLSGTTNAKFRAVVNYDYEYTFTGSNTEGETQAKVSVVDYSAIA